MVLEQARSCWAYIFQRCLSGVCWTKSYDAVSEFHSVSLASAVDATRLDQPVTAPGLAGAISLSQVDGVLSGEYVCVLEGGLVVSVVECGAD